MSDQQYDVSPKMRELFEKKQAQRKAAKEYYFKQLFNPFSPDRPFDPVQFRYTSLSAYSYTYYRPNTKRKLYGILGLLPFGLLVTCVHYNRKKREELFRSGKIAYADRPNILGY